MTGEKSDDAQDTGLVEKAFLMGIGAAAFAKEKAEELAEELIRRGSLTREQSGTFVNRLASEAEQAGRTARSTVSHEAERAIAGVGLASARDVEELRAELVEIKALIAALRPTGANAGADSEASPGEEPEA